MEGKEKERGAIWRKGALERMEWGWEGKGGREGLVRRCSVEEYWKSRSEERYRQCGGSV